jgi:glutamate dehydrogenase
MEAISNDKIVVQLTRFIAERLTGKPAKQLADFAKHYFQFVVSEDIEERMLEDLYGAVLSHWNMLLDYQPGQEKIQVYNPTMEEHGWQSQHTIVEIVVEDMPFLLQSITMEINQHGFANHLVIHPVYYIQRSEQGHLLSFSTVPEENATAECIVHVEIDRQSSNKEMTKLKHDLQRILIDVRAATQDWSVCLDKMSLLIDELKDDAKQHSDRKLEESIAFLQWLHDDHFIFLGYREYEIVRQKEQTGFRLMADTGLGVLRDSIASIPKNNFFPITEDVYQTFNNEIPLLVTKATSKATVHRPAFMDYIGIKQYNNQGNVIGEKRFLGLYSSSAYYCSLDQIPMVSSKINRLMARSGFQRKSHDARALLFVLQSLPRNELFQADDDSLYECAFGVLRLQERQRVKVFVRHDVYGHFVSLLIYVPRERYHTESRRKIQDILLATFHGQDVDFSVQLSESILARIHFIIHSAEDCSIEYDVREIEEKIVDALAEWKDDLERELHNYFGEAKGNEFLHAYSDGFSAAYREDFSPRTALLDLKKIEKLCCSGESLQLLLYRPLTAADKKSLRFKLYRYGAPAALSMCLPMLENMGVRVCEERPYEIRKKDSHQSFWMHDFGLIYDDVNTLDLTALKDRFQDAFQQVWNGHAENDGFNRLVIEANLEWQQVNIFRAFYFYLRQIEITFSQSYVEQTLAKNPTAVALLIKLFNARFNPTQGKDQSHIDRIIEQTEMAIDQVSSLDEDRILRRYLNLILSIMRTNYFCKPIDESGFPYFSFKMDPKQVMGMPAPAPVHEIFIYSPRMEGIHLRGGSVARGGLRWSDRREDFRTEILGLMKAQMTKNVVIVPTGAKGGFVVKRLQEVDNQAQEVVACYRILIRGLLDLTDNRVGDDVIKPANVLCYDDDDPYLVVAADKGTATFSDHANTLSERYGFWLGDAFASGGSVGYDHKKMGITARGAWESVKHHFECLNINSETTPFTVIGIGGMSGDVFGNGMLLSRQIKLLGVFDHESIFLDPSPDVEASYQERNRLFNISRCSWKDYDPGLISRGGGVYSRQAKSIPLSEEVRQLLNIKDEHLTPNALIRALLCAAVDLLWNGGIGTYVKASEESNVDVGDRANDAVRVNGKQLRCKCVGEGGNLGFTQLGRIEYAQNNGRLNTDSIDNSAGVDCSDHEVNIKILLNSLVQQSDLTIKKRNELLVQMTNDVAELVLKNNYQQNRAITMFEADSKKEMSMIHRLIEKLEQADLLDRNLEHIPSNEILAERKANGAGLTRPEAAVLLAYSKSFLKEAFLYEGDTLDQDFHKQELMRYFPEQLQKEYANEIQLHRLGKEIVANQLINNLVNRLGVVSYRLIDESGCSVAAVVNTYKLVCTVFDIDNLWSMVENMDDHVNTEVQCELKLKIRKMIERATNWFIHNELHDGSLAEIIPLYKNGITELNSVIHGLLPEVEQQAIDQEVERLIDLGAPAGLDLKIALMDVLFLCLDVIQIHKKSAHSMEDVAKIYFSLMTDLNLTWLRKQISLLPKETEWESRARKVMREVFKDASCLLTEDVLKITDVPLTKKLEQWFATNQTAISRYEQLIKSMHTEKEIDLEKITVLLKGLRSIKEE